MKKALNILLTSVLFSAAFLGGASLALADTAQPLSFYCEPYGASFVDGQAYEPTEGGFCNFQMDSFDPSALAIVEIYKGVPGNATLLDSKLRTDCSLSSCTTTDSFGNAPQPGDAYFSVGYVIGTDISDYVSTGTNPPTPDVFRVLSWHWGTPATVRADDQTIHVGDALPTLTATVSGFVNGDTLATSGITGSASCTTSAADSSVAGDFPITCTQGSLASTKYSFTVPTASYVGGVLHVVPPLPTCSISASPASVVQGSGSTLTFSSTNATSGTIDNGVGAVATSGTTSVTPGTTTTYTDTVTGAGGTATCSTTLTATPAAVDTKPPVITITSPLKNGVYAKTDSVFLTAIVTDASPIAKTTYWFGTKKINQALPLPLSTVSTPSIQSVSVSATDIRGNTATSTLKFFVVKTKNSCLLDIIALLVAITKDKTLPDQPTIQDLIADCSALLMGLHRFDADIRHR